MNSGRESFQWPSDDLELDALARSLPVPEPTTGQVEQNRTRLLALTQVTPQQPEVRSRAFYVACALPLLAAACIGFWVAMTDDKGHSFVAQVNSSPAQVGVVKAPSTTNFSRSNSNDEGSVVNLKDGQLEVAVANLADNERFRVRAWGAEIETRNARFDVHVGDKELLRIDVREGRVELRSASSSTLTITQGEVWLRDDNIEAPDDASDEKPEPAKPESAKPESAKPESAKPENGIQKRPRNPRRIGNTSKPGEDEFRQGWESFRGGNVRVGAAKFALACRLAARGSIGSIAEDACFWSGAAAKKSGQARKARVALKRFLRRFPRSSRVGEASALLGWILYDAGEKNKAKSLFQHAAKDNVPRVKQSAQKGLKAIEQDS